MPEAWAPAGDRFLYTVTRGSSVTLWTLSLKEQTNTRIDAVESYAPIGAVFSPDGQWIAYATNNTVYVQPFPPTGSQYQISRTNAGHHPIWSSDGRELFYEPTQYQFVAVPVRTQPSFTFGNPVSWPGPYGSRQHLSPRNRDLAPDGKRFICPVPPSRNRSGNPRGPELARGAEAPRADKIESRRRNEASSAISVPGSRRATDRTRPAVGRRANRPRHHHPATRFG